jgi:alkaline phosphatase
MSISRRGFLRRSGWLTASAVAVPQWLDAAGSASARPGQKPRHIIHLVSDGMSLGTLTCADHFSHLTRQRGLAWVELYHRPAACSAWMNMRSLNSLVTDSSAASSSWGSGSRVVNGVLNQLPDGRVLRTLYHLFAEAGWTRGLVTTTEITHATPAGFAASTPKRDDAEFIAIEYLERRVEVLLGGGQKFFDPKKRKDKRDVRATFRARGYELLSSLWQLASAPADKPWLGLFAESHLPFTLDHRADKEKLLSIPTLADMTRAALRKLQRESHFMLQVEGGRVDHACHNCDAAAAMHDQIAFDEALEVCLEFQQREPETLLVMTTDHGTANPGLNGMGEAYAKSSPLFANLKQVRCSFPEITKRLAKAAGVAESQKIIRDTTGYKVSEGKAQAFEPFLKKKGQTAFDGMNSVTAQLGQLLANHLGISWTGGAHTADYVPLLAIGPGAERFRGFLQNVEVFRHYLALAGVDYRNPEAPLMAETGPSASEVEDIAAYGEGAAAELA